MRKVESTVMEDCLKGTLTLLYHFDAAWTKEDIMKLAALGKLDYFADFPRPYFRLESPENVQMKGVESELTCRVIYPADDRERIHAEFEQKIEKLLG